MNAADVKRLVELHVWLVEFIEALQSDDSMKIKDFHLRRPTPPRETKAEFHDRMRSTLVFRREWSDSCIRLEPRN